ncbi:MAG: NAD(+)/NADH kinase, partial [Clostridia bacterium]|nr:NAD(+)/NADH kinase [Clostridia bacterium]
VPEGVKYGVFNSHADLNADLLFSIGGDGTILDTVPFVLDSGMPVVGINMGRLGFLAELETDQLNRLDALFSGDYTVAERMTLAVTADLGAGEFDLPGYPLNDVVFSHDREDGLALLSLSDQDGNVIDYHADGLILATPSGSTAYTLSAGGPIIDDAMKAICVTPVCPHSFFNRSVVFGADSVLTVENRSPLGRDATVSLDGRERLRLPFGAAVTVKRSDRPLKMLSLDRHAVLSTLNRKMQMADMKYRNE